MKRSILLLLLMTAGVNTIRAQSIAPSIINAAGGSATLAGNKYDWSVGEMTMVSTLTGSGVIVTQGILQPFHYVPTSVSDPSFADDLQVFPNPAISALNIRYNSAGKGTLSYSLYDMRGSQVRWGVNYLKQGATTCEIYIDPISCGSYVLEITLTDENNAIKKASYKIEKVK